jgi:hypothetical protein
VRLVRASIAMVLAVTAFSACGGGGSQGGDGEAVSLAEGSTPKAEYVRRINDLCEIPRPVIERVAESARTQLEAGATEDEAYRHAVGELVAFGRASFERAIEIPPPEGDRAELERYFETAFETFGIVEESLDATERGDLEAADVPDERLNALSDEANSFAGSYGIVECQGLTDDGSG